MIGCPNDHHMAWQIVYLHEQRTYHALDLTGLVHMTAFLSEGFKLVEKEDAFPSGGILKQFLQADSGLAQVGADDALIANHKQWDYQCASAMASANVVLPLPGGPMRSTRLRGSRL